MDSERFDRFVRRFGQTRSRRQTLRGLAGLAAVGGLALAVPEAAALRCSASTPCPACFHCRHHHCHKQANDVPCTGGTCRDGTCLPQVTPCNAQNCPGCCDGTTCNAGSANHACGSGGGACQRCSGPQTCGGGGTAGVCGCTPTTCAAERLYCGTIQDGCNALLNCGGCYDGQWCNSGTCDCDPVLCRGGCCNGTSCVYGGENNACGSGGGACQRCVSPQVCRERVCVTV